MVYSLKFGFVHVPGFSEKVVFIDWLDGLKDCGLAGRDVPFFTHLKEDVVCLVQVLVVNCGKHVMHSVDIETGHHQEWLKAAFYLGVDIVARVNRMLTEILHFLLPLCPQALNSVASKSYFGEKVTKKALNEQEKLDWLD